MQLGMVGLGRIGGNMAIRLMRAGHDVFVCGNRTVVVQDLVSKGARGSTKPVLIAALTPPRSVLLMVLATAVDSVLGSIVPVLKLGDTVIDGGNSYCLDDLRRAEQLKAGRLHYVDVGVSGGVWGLERGYCQMIGGEPEIVARLDPIFRSLAPGVDAAPRISGAIGREPTQAERGYLHCGPNGAGHFVKMVHNGIEYGLIAALVEGFGILKKTNAGRTQAAIDAETTSFRNPKLYDYDFDVAAIAELWRRGSVVSSWLLDLAASALRKDPSLAGFSGRVSDSSEGRWTLQAAIDEGVPAPVLSSALFSRFASRGEAEYEDKLLSALRFEFGGHVEKSSG